MPWAEILAKSKKAFEIKPVDGHEEMGVYASAFDVFLVESGERIFKTAMSKEFCIEWVGNASDIWLRERAERILLGD